MLKLQSCDERLDLQDKGSIPLFENTYFWLTWLQSQIGHFMTFHDYMVKINTCHLNWTFKTMSTLLECILSKDIYLL